MDRQEISCHHGVRCEEGLITGVPRVPRSGMITLFQKVFLTIQTVNWREQDIRQGNRPVEVGTHERLCMHAQSDSLQPLGPPGSSVRGILQARILKWIFSLQGNWSATPSSRGSSWSGDWAHGPRGHCMGRQILYYWAIWEAHWKVGRL